MENRKTRALSVDMTKGSEMKTLLYFTLPMLLGNLCQQLYNVVDSAIVGRILGEDALAAVGATGSLTFFFYTFSNGMGTGTGIIVSQYYGMKNERALRKSIFNSSIVILIISLFITFVSIMLTPFLMNKVMATPRDISPMSITYMRIACAGTVAVAAYNWCSFIMRALGDSKTPLIFLIMSSLINVILDLVFILVLHMGVGGAALATVIAQGICAVLSIAFCLLKNPYFKFRREELRPELSMCMQVVRIGLPIAAQSSLIAVSMMALQRVANGFGKTVMSAYTATMRIEQLIQQPFASLGQALSAFAGQNAGARQYERIKIGYHKSLILLISFAFATMSIFLLFADRIVGIFVDAPNVIGYGATGLRVSCLFYVFLGLIHVTRGLLNGAGDTNYSFLNGCAEVGGRIGFALLFVYVLKFGFVSVWATSALTWFITGIMSVIRYKGRKWMTKGISSE